MSRNNFNPWERHQCNPWVLLIGVGIIGVLMMVFFSGTIAVQTHKLATQNQVEEVKMNNEFKHVGGRVVVEETDEITK